MNESIYLAHPRINGGGQARIYVWRAHLLDFGLVTIFGDKWSVVSDLCLGLNLTFRTCGFCLRIAEDGMHAITVQ